MPVFRVYARVYEEYFIDIEAIDAVEANKKAGEREIGWEAIDGSEWEQLDEETRLVE